jgi:flagellin-like protein
MKPEQKDTGGISPVIGVVLMVAIVVVLAAAVATTVLGIGSTSENTEIDFDVRYEPEPGPSTPYDEIILTNRAGESVDISALEIGVAAPKGEARLVSLPVPNSREETSLDPPSDDDLKNIYADGDAAILQGGIGWGGVIYGGTDDADRKWEPGDRLIIPLDSSEAYSGSAKPEEGDSIEITVVDKDSGSLIGSEEIAPVEFVR